MKSRLPTGLPRTTTPCSAAGRAQFPVQHGFSGSCGGEHLEESRGFLPCAVPRACLTEVYLDVGMSREGLAHDGELADRVHLAGVAMMPSAITWPLAHGLGYCACVGAHSSERLLEYAGRRAQLSRCMCLYVVSMWSLFARTRVAYRSHRDRPALGLPL